MIPKEAAAPDAGPDTSKIAGPLARALAGQPGLRSRLGAFERAAASDAPVLIVGEPGSLPTTLFESELFGYRRGAFTGAEAPRAGRVERAAGGTLLLDHVEELPLASQAKLLRLVAEGVYAPLGGREERADVRFLAVGSEDLPRRVASGAFREDLFYRLEVLAFRVPPLRERPEDLPGLIDRLLADLSERFGRPGLALAPGAREWMTRHPWPGNARQVRNTLERALVLASGRSPLDPDPPAGAEERPRSLDEVEATEIRRALAYTRGHQAEAARLLGISRKALWAKRKRHGIP